jgi:hypothetical protein
MERLARVRLVGLRWSADCLLRRDLPIWKRDHGYNRHPVRELRNPTTFDAAQVETTSAIDLPGGHDLDPIGALNYTGVNGLPPVGAAVQGTQTFDYANADGTTGSFGADVTNTLDEFDDSTETVLVTSGSDPDAPIGSVFETATFGDSGIESFYTDIPSTTGGADVITDILQTPLGDFTIPTSLDAIAGVVTDLLSAASG